MIKKIEELKNINRILDNSFHSLKRMTTGNYSHIVGNQLCIIHDNIIPRLKKVKKSHSYIENIIESLYIFCDRIENIQTENFSHSVGNILQSISFTNLRLKIVIKDIQRGLKR